jgi:transcriptional regulator with XRE-family HTH domain
MPLDIRIRFGRAIRRIREEQEINQEEAAERCGLHRTYYSGIERGVRNVSLVNIGRVAKGSRATKTCDAGKTKGQETLGRLSGSSCRSDRGFDRQRCCVPQGARVRRLDGTGAEAVLDRRQGKALRHQ